MVQSYDLYILNLHFIQNLCYKKYFEFCRWFRCKVPLYILNLHFWCAPSEKRRTLITTYISNRNSVYQKILTFLYDHHRHLLHRLVCFFFYFLCFFWLNRVYLWYLVLVLHFHFSIYQVMAKWIHVGWFHTYEGLSLALERSWFTCLSAGVATVCWK